MPVITVKVFEGELRKDQTAEIIADITEAVIPYVGEADPKAEPRQGVAEGEKEYTAAVAERLATWSNTEKTITPNGGSR